MATKSNKPHEMSTEERWNWYHGIDIPESEAKRKAGIMKMLNDPKAAERARKNMALRKKIEEEGSKKEININVIWTDFLNNIKNTDNSIIKY